MDAAARRQKTSLGDSQRASDGAGAIDVTHLRRFTLGDKNLEVEILGLFITQVPLSIDTLRHAETDEDWTTAAHTLKGSARAVGAWRLARLAEHAEKLGGPSNASEREQVLRDLEAAVTEARGHIESLSERT